MPLRAEDVAGLDRAVRAAAVVVPTPERRAEQIEGVRIQPVHVATHAGGSVCEVYDERWGFTDDPVPYVYRVTLRPGQIRGWVVHREQFDRLFFAFGTARLSLWDGRTGSDTYRTLQVELLGADQPALVRIPAGVYHAVRNVGEDHVRFVNLPSRPYEHEDPDKYRLPLDNEVIPYRP